MILLVFECKSNDEMKVTWNWNWEIRNAYSIFIGKHCGRTHFGDQLGNWEDGVETLWERCIWNTNWFEQVQEIVEWQILWRHTAVPYKVDNFLIGLVNLIIYINTVVCLLHHDLLNYLSVLSNLDLFIKLVIRQWRQSNCFY